MTHVAWSCDGKRLAAMEQKHATTFSGAHTDDVDYVSWNPTHPDLFATSSQKDRRIVFWDARQSRHTQQCSLKVSPVQTNYSPDGRSLLYTSAGHQLFFLTLGKEADEPKEQWHISPKDPHTLRVMDYPSLFLRDSFAAHVGDNLASGGHDSIVNVFDLTEWICVRTITACDHSINSLSFSYDGEYLAIANAGTYIDIRQAYLCNRVPALAASPTVGWHPSKYAIAYCGQTNSGRLAHHQSLLLVFL
ncbi:WD40-repeat-containing domain protein, partial [Mycena rebaudengoi]